MGFDGTEFLDNLKTITGDESRTVLPTMSAQYGFDVDAVDLVHFLAKEQEMEDLFKGMRADGNVLSGGRQRRNGRNEYSDLDLINDSTTIDNVLIQSSMDMLAELQALYDVREQMLDDLKEWRAENLSAEENAAIDALPEEEQFDATKRIMDEKLAAGEIDAEQYAQFMQRYEAYQANENAITKKEEHALSWDENLSRDENAALIAHQFSLKRLQLIEKRAEIDARLGDNIILIDRLNTLRARGGSRQDVVDLVDDTPDLDVDIPDEATFDESITLLEQTVTADSAALEVERVEVNDEISAIETSQQTLSVLAPETKSAMDAERHNVEVFEERIEVTTLTGGFSLALNANDPLDAPKETVADATNDGQQDTYVADLGLKTDLTG